MGIYQRLKKLVGSHFGKGSRKAKLRGYLDEELATQGYTTVLPKSNERCELILSDTDHSLEDIITTCEDRLHERPVKKTSFPLSRYLLTGDLGALQNYTQKKTNTRFMTLPAKDGKPVRFSDYVDSLYHKVMENYNGLTCVERGVLSGLKDILIGRPVEGKVYLTLGQRAKEINKQLDIARSRGDKHIMQAAYHLINNVVSRSVAFREHKQDDVKRLLRDAYQFNPDKIYTFQTQAASLKRDSEEILKHTAQKYQLAWPQMHFLGRMFDQFSQSSVQDGVASFKDRVHVLRRRGQGKLVDAAYESLFRLYQQNETFQKAANTPIVASLLEDAYHQVMIDDDAIHEAFRKSAQDVVRKYKGLPEYQYNLILQASDLMGAHDDHYLQTIAKGLNELEKKTDWRVTKRALLQMLDGALERSIDLRDALDKGMESGLLGRAYDRLYNKVRLMPKTHYKQDHFCPDCMLV